MERTLDVRTGESIAIRYELAGLGSRFLAVAIDVTIQVGLTIAILIAIGLASGPITTAVAALHLDVKTVQALGIALLLLAFFLVYFGYFIAFELWWSGRTPGKRALGIRVVRDAGFPLDLGGAVIRNVVRIVEFGLGLYALSAIVALVSRENKRLGDFAAGTIVVRDRKYDVADLDAYVARESTRTDDGLDAAERDLVERFIARKKTLDPQARRALAAQIAERLRPRLRASFDHLSDEALLDHLAGIDR